MCRVYCRIKMIGRIEEIVFLWCSFIVFGMIDLKRVIFYFVFIYVKNENVFYNLYLK